MLSEHLPSLVPSTTTNHNQILGRWFDWAVVVCSIWFITGLVLDGWAHAHGKVDNTFFTPWHAVFYSGFAAVAAIIAIGILLGMLKGIDWRQALPTGYHLTLIGLPLFALGGVGDMAWHILFGIETNLDALLSPTHLLLASSMSLIFAGPIYAAWNRPTRTIPNQTEIIPLPALLALVFIHTLLSFMTEFINPYVDLLAQHGYDEHTRALGVASIMLQSAILSGILLTALRRWRIPVGGYTAILAVNAIAMSVFDDHTWVIISALAAGLVIDLLAYLLQPNPSKPVRLRIFLFLVPSLLYLSYFLGIMRIGPIAWSIHLWLGSIFAAGVIGVGMSLLITNPEHRT